MHRRQFLQLTVLTTGTLLGIPLIADRTSSLAACLPPPQIPSPDQWSDQTISMAWIGHSTVLINLFGRWILTDPVLLDFIGLSIFNLFTLGPRRIFAPALSIDQLPRPDFILLSHAHMDHLDYRSLQALTKRFPNQLTVITAANTADIISDLRWKRIIELDWKEWTTIDGIYIEAIPVKHFGWRFPWELDRAKNHLKGRSYNGYLLEYQTKTLVFGGDTALTSIFQSYADVDIAIMPIGAYRPWHHVHCTPEEAIKMAMMLNAKVIAPIHCTTFLHGREPFWEPPKRFITALQAQTSLAPAWINIGSTFTL